MLANGVIYFAAGIWFGEGVFVHALDAATGKEIWRKNLVQDYGSKIPPWYNGQCPLLEDDRETVLEDLDDAPAKVGEFAEAALEELGIVG